MAKQIIDVGSFPNSRDGDSLRNAVIKINANTDELYATDGIIYGLLETKVEKVAGETLTPNKFTNEYKAKLDSAESTTGAQSKADAAEAAAKSYADDKHSTLQLQLEDRALVSETGYSLTANQATATVYLRDKNNNVLSSLSVGFLNNEGTEITYNATTEELELKNDDGEILSAFPVSSLLTNVGKNLNLNGASLELRDTTNTILSSVTLNISNIANLQATLDSKESIENVNTKVEAAENNAIEWVKQFGLGTSVTTHQGDLNLLTQTGFVFAGATTTNKPTGENGWVLNQSLDSNNSVQTFLSPNGMYTRTQISGVFSAWGQMETTVGSQTKIDSLEASTKTYTDAGLATKVDIIEGKGLSTEDFTTEEKTKLSTAESITGSQDKANAAESAAKTYADVGDANLQLQIDNITTGDDFVDVISDESIGGVKTFTEDTHFEGDIIVTGSITEGGESLSSKYETPAGAQTKADAALSSAISDADSKLTTKVDKVEGMGLSQENFTTQEKNKLSTAESLTGAQDKADAAEAAAKSHADAGDLILQSQIDNITTGDGFVDTTSDESIGGVKTFTDDTHFDGDIVVGGVISENGQLLSDRYETPEGAQTKASAAQSASNSYTDSRVSTKVDKVEGMGLSEESFTTTEKLKLSTAESLTGAQEKADVAQQNAIDYTDIQLLLKQNLLVPDDDSITIDELNNIRVNTEDWDLVTQFNNQVNFE